MTVGGPQDPWIQIHAYIMKATAQGWLVSDQFGKIPGNSARDSENTDLPCPLYTGLPKSLLRLEISAAHCAASRKVK
jgi:hypothetical protein